MPTYEKLKGAIALASNTPGQPTGYGQQAEMLVERLVSSGLDVAVLSNYGTEGNSTVQKIAGKEVRVYPRGYKAFSDDVIKPYFEDFVADKPQLKKALFTLYDVWVYNDLDFSDEIISWTPLDHVSLPPKVAKFLMRPNVTPITMSPHGQRQLEAAGIESRYIPHAIETEVYKPTYKMLDGSTAREYLGIGGEFLVGMVSANKANGILHRKAFAENILAFSMFKAKHPEAKLYIHAEPTHALGGFNLPILLRACGLKIEDVIFPNPLAHRLGFAKEDMAALYTAFDVLLHTNYGEGFGITSLEAQACGTRVITSNWAASQDLVSDDSYLVNGYPFWDETQAAFLQIPNVNEIAQALENAFTQERGVSDYAVEFSKKFDVDSVWQWYWQPFLKGFFK